MTLKKLSLMYRESDRYGIYGCFFYYRSLLNMTSKLMEWSKKVNYSVINSSIYICYLLFIEVNKKSILVLEEIYSEIEPFYLPILEEQILKESIEKYHKSSEIAKKILNKELKVTVDEFESLMIDCSNVFAVMTEFTKPLKLYQKLIHNWLKDFAKIDKLPVEEVITIKERLLELPIKEDDYIEILNKQSVVYCICKEKENGEMICCDICKKWYHDYCFDLDNKPQPEMFFCPNCLVYIFVFIYL